MRSLWAGLPLWARFAAAGALNTAFGYAAFACLTLAGAGPLPALAAATTAGIAFNFQTSRRMVFRTGGRAARFAALYGAILLLNWAALHALHGAGWPSLGAQALLAAPVAALSFGGQKAFVFGAAASRA